MRSNKPACTYLPSRASPKGSCMGWLRISCSLGYPHYDGDGVSDGVDIVVGCTRHQVLGVSPIQALCWVKSWGLSHPYQLCILSFIKLFPIQQVSRIIISLQDNKLLVYLPESHITIYIHVVQFQNTLCTIGLNQDSKELKVSRLLPLKLRWCCHAHPS